MRDGCLATGRPPRRGKRDAAAYLTSVDWQTPRPAVEGSQIDFAARFLGRRLAYTYVIREIVPDQRFVMSTSSSWLPDRREAAQPSQRR
jgi:hypothetical protein